MKNQIKVQTHQIYQFKQDISSKEAFLLKVRSKCLVFITTLFQLNLDHTRIEKEKANLRSELQRLRKTLEESALAQTGMEKQLANLHQVIRDADSERRKQQNELTQIMTERNLGFTYFFSSEVLFEPFIGIFLVRNWFVVMMSSHFCMRRQKFNSQR